MKKKRMMTTIMDSLDTVILPWGKLKGILKGKLKGRLKGKLKGMLKGKLKGRHMMSPLMILVGPLLMHGETAEVKMRGRSWITC